MLPLNIQIQKILKHCVVPTKWCEYVVGGGAYRKHWYIKIYFKMKKAGQKEESILGKKVREAVL